MSLDKFLVLSYQVIENLISLNTLETVLVKVLQK